MTEQEMEEMATKIAPHRQDLTYSIIKRYGANQSRSMFMWYMWRVVEDGVVHSRGVGYNSEAVRYKRNYSHLE